MKRLALLLALLPGPGFALTVEDVLAEAKADCAKGLDILARTMGSSAPFYISSKATCAQLGGKS